MPSAIFPNELWLDIIPHLELQPLIAIRCTSRTLRSLAASAASANIHPLRKAFLSLYLDIIDRPWFLETRPWLLENLRPFDRQAYLDAIAAFPGVHIPEDFAMWIMEWPECAVIKCMWPGLPLDQGYRARYYAGHRAGWNCLGMIPPTVLAFTMMEEIDLGLNTFTRTPGLLLWDQFNSDIEYLLLHRGERFRGYIVGGNHRFYAEVLSHPDEPHPDDPFWTSWIAYLEDSANAVQATHRLERLALEGAVYSFSPYVLDPSQRVSASLPPWPPAPA
ncbi:hypothetical protein HGRIS_006112 [Hohenbuehelia grisea]|uniref:F-box domain-containing protein n=1 Tax=Hohenbuehelia grisea TaxID=104357 RepID=A0ABR3K0G5_9AGAR